MSPYLTNKQKEIIVKAVSGNSVVIFGAQGTGKTTTLRAISGLVQAHPSSFARLDLNGLRDKRTLNRFAGIALIIYSFPPKLSTS